MTLAETINGAQVEGMVAIYFKNDGTETYDSVVLTDYVSAAVTDVQRSLSKSPIEVPIPYADAVGFDIGFTESDSITITMTSLDGISSATTVWEKLLNLFKYKAGIDQDLPYGVAVGTYFVAYCLMKQLSCTIEAGKGDIVSISMTFGVVEAPEET